MSVVEMGPFPAPKRALAVAADYFSAVGLIEDDER